jgi:hypothetical protein
VFVISVVAVICHEKYSCFDMSSVFIIGITFKKKCCSHDHESKVVMTTKSIKRRGGIGISVMKGQRQTT